VKTLQYVIVIYNQCWLSQLQVCSINIWHSTGVGISVWDV